MERKKYLIEASKMCISFEFGNTDDISYQKFLDTIEQLKSIVLKYKDEPTDNLIAMLQSKISESKRERINKSFFDNIIQEMDNITNKEWY